MNDPKVYGVISSLIVAIQLGLTQEYYKAMDEGRPWPKRFALVDPEQVGAISDVVDQNHSFYEASGMKAIDQEMSDTFKRIAEGVLKGQT